LNPFKGLVILSNLIHKWGRRRMDIEYWWESQKEGDHLEGNDECERMKLILER
jgi:hypothetical protein